VIPPPRVSLSEPLNYQLQIVQNTFPSILLSSYLYKYSSKYCLLLELPFILYPNNTPPRKQPCPQGCKVDKPAGYKILFESDQSALSCSSCQTTVVSNDDKSFPNTIEARSTWQ